MRITKKKKRFTIGKILQNGKTHSQIEVYLFGLHTHHTKNTI